jgi:membrane-bound lytic murein transglycosylase MltF
MVFIRPHHTGRLYGPQGRSFLATLLRRAVTCWAAWLPLLLTLFPPGGLHLWAADIPSGSLRTVSLRAPIMSARSLDSEYRGHLNSGEWVKTGFRGNDWLAVFHKNDSAPDESHALGYVYAPLLKPFSDYMRHVWVPAQENHHDPRVSLSEEICKLDYDYDENALLTLVPQLSRLAAPHSGDLPEMLARRTIRVLTTYSLSTYFISRGRGYGFEHSLLKDYERFLNQSHPHDELQTVVEFIPMPEKHLIPSLQQGLGDIVAAGLRMTPERQEVVDFSAPYLTDVREVLVVHRSSRPLTEIADLAGRTVYVQPGWNRSKTLRRINARLTVMELPPMQPITTNAFLTSEDVLELVNAGIFELTIVESHIAALWGEILPRIQIFDPLDISEPTPIAWIVRKNCPLLKNSLNHFLQTRRPGSRFGNIYYDQYFRNVRLIRNPLAPTDRAKFSQYVPLFRKYGAAYGFDWMLLAALAFQESKMVHARVSPMGAVGLMQVIPTTAEDPNIDIPAVWNVANNIHAGTKYLAFLRDVYYSDPAIRPEDRVRLALAAYNAGPAKINRCRIYAAQLGYDPNQWFYNTEVAARKLIGEETVRYVSNVKKYYLAYSLGHTLECLKAQHIENLKSGAVLPGQIAEAESLPK